MSVGLRKKFGQLFKNEGDRLFSENHEPPCIVSSDASQTSSCKNQVERKIKTLDVFRVQAIPEVDPHIKHGDHPTLPLATCTQARSRQELNTTKMPDRLYPCTIQPIVQLDREYLSWACHSKPIMIITATCTRRSNPVLGMSQVGPMRTVAASHVGSQIKRKATLTQVVTWHQIKTCL